MKDIVQAMDVLAGDFFCLLFIADCLARIQVAIFYLVIWFSALYLKTQ